MKDYRDKVLACIDRGLEHLGESVKQVIYWHLENRFGLKREGIPDRVEDFIRGLEDMYGSGAEIIEKNIAREIIKEFGVEGDSEDLIEVVRKVEKDHR